LVADGTETRVLTLDQAQSIILASVSALPSESTPLLEALGCVLAEPIVARVPLPPFDNSAMDGYAVIATDTRGATPGAARILSVIEDIPAGTAPTRRVESGTAARIMTGAMMPPGADAVVIVEHTRPGVDGTVEVLVPAEPGDDIRPAGEDIRKDQVALSPGQVLGPGELGLAAALGCTHASVVRRPRVAIVTTGSELVEPGKELKPGTIYNSNQVLLAGRVLSAGMDVAERLHVEDDEKAVENALARCADADIILTTGGISVGKYDFVKAALEKLGEIKFWRVLIKPGKPVAFGNVLGRPLFGLPGNPVSALVTFELLVAPALRKMSGRADCLPPTVQATLLGDVSHKPGRREHRQAVTRLSDHGYVSDPSPKRGSAMLTSTIGSNSLVVVREESEGLRKGEKATVIFPAYRDL
jgi:molybdopterin molybdotransferase